MLLMDGRINSTAICFSRSGAAWDRGEYEMDTGQYDATEEVFGACAGAALFRRSMLDEIGLFDEDFFLFMEDVDLAFRARLAGWKCMYVPTAKVVHVRGGTSGTDSSLSVYFGNRNLLWYIIKDFPATMLFTSLPWIVGRNCVEIPFYLLRGKGLAIFRAKVDMLRGLYGMIQKRDTIQRKVPVKEMKKWISPAHFSWRKENR
jgi:GT2 family glycosyltransferase